MRRKVEPLINQIESTINWILSPQYNVSMIIPARNEENNVAKVISVGLKSKLIDNVVVIDSFSNDKTNKVSKDAGAKVIRQRKGYYGKGGAVKTAYEEVKSNIYVFYDADIKDARVKDVGNLVKPILNGTADHTIAKFSYQTSRVTTLTAKPLLDIYFPEVKFKKPLSGLFAIKRNVLGDINIVRDWGVEIGKNIDVVMKGYTTKEVDLGKIRDNPSKSVEELIPMAQDVVRTIMNKAIEYGRMPTQEDIENVLSGNVVIQPNV